MKSAGRDLISGNNLPPVQYGGRILRLQDSTEIDVSDLTEGQRQELEKLHAANMIDLRRKAAEKQIDLQSLDSKMTVFTNAVRGATESGTAATISNVKEDELGRTEIMIGNTDAAKVGRLSNRQAGTTDKTLIYVLIAAVVIVLIIAIAAGQ